MGFIELENMEFYAFHGHYKEERIVGNKFLVNVSIETDLSKPAETDSLDDALNYQKVYQIIKLEMNKKSHLLENIASRIINALYDNFKTILSAKIKISKLNPPMGGKMQSVSVTLEKRWKKD